MKVPVDFGDKKLREVELFHTFAYGKEIYRSHIITHPISKKPCYVEYDPDTGEITVKEVEA